MKTFFTNLFTATFLTMLLYCIFAFVACLSTWDINYISLAEWGQAGRTVFAINSVVIWLVVFFELEE